jgi:acetyl-CoA carboxylase carboxyl transferase subunit beta
VDNRKYSDRLQENQRKTQLPDAVVSSKGQLGGIDVIICAMDFSFMGGSMGSVVGEKITRAIERATAEKLPMIIVSCSGGARMQEGALSLMQMAKTSAALGRLDEAKLPFISVMTDPTAGGTTASYSMLGDFNIAEPNSYVGFAGPRVIEQTIREKLPKGFQRAEFLLAHGLLDDVVDRKALRGYLIRVLRLLLNRYP